VADVESKGGIAVSVPSDGLPPFTQISAFM
jgi:hypothetical protein